MSGAFFASFAFIFVKAFQQLNVMRDNRWLVIPTSLLMSACEVYVVVVIATEGYGLVVLPIGLGGGFGCLASMIVHGRWFNKRH